MTDHQDLPDPGTVEADEHDEKAELLSASKPATPQTWLTDDQARIQDYAEQHMLTLEEAADALSASPAAPAQSADLAAQEAGFADFQSALNWIAGHQCNCCEPSPTAVMLDDERAALLADYVELNMSNYGPDDVDKLNAWGIEAYGYLARAASPQPVEQTRALTGEQRKALETIIENIRVWCPGLATQTRIAESILPAARPASGEIE